jgi:hypothetical protein
MTQCTTSTTKRVARRWWLTPVILAAQEVEIRRTVVRSQPRLIVHETLSLKHPSHIKKRAGGVAQGESPEFKTQNHQKKKKWLGM